MTSPEGKVAVIEETRTAKAGVEERERSPRVEVASEERRDAEKPQASEEIVIEEISIDGMCGVY